MCDRVKEGVDSWGEGGREGGREREREREREEYKGILTCGSRWRRRTLSRGRGKRTERCRTRRREEEICTEGLGLSVERLVSNIQGLGFWLT